MFYPILSELLLMIYFEELKLPTSIFIIDNFKFFFCD